MSDRNHALAYLARAMRQADRVPSAPPPTPVHELIRRIEAMLADRTAAMPAGSVPNGDHAVAAEASSSRRLRPRVSRPA